MKNKVEEAAAKLRSWKEAKIKGYRNGLVIPSTPAIEVVHKGSSFVFYFKQKEGKTGPDNHIIDAIQLDDSHDFDTIMTVIRSAFPSVIVKGELHNNFDLRKLKKEIDKLRPKK